MIKPIFKNRVPYLTILLFIISGISFTSIFVGPVYTREHSISNEEGLLLEENLERKNNLRESLSTADDYPLSNKRHSFEQQSSLAPEPKDQHSPNQESVTNFKWPSNYNTLMVVQNRKFIKRDRLYVNAGGGVGIANAFQNVQNFQFRGGYFFTEQLGLEALYGKHFAHENDTAKIIRSQGTVPFYRSTQSYYGGLVLWTPFYSKMNAFNKILYYDPILGLGITRINEKNNKKQLTSKNEQSDSDSYSDGSNDIQNQGMQTDNHVALAWDLGMKFYYSQNFNVRLSILGQHYQAPRVNGRGNEGGRSIFSTYDVALLLGYTI